MEAPYQVAVGGASVIDRHRALQHFGSEGVMDSLLQRFPETVRGTLCRLRAAWMEGRDEDLRCHIYQIRGAASWVCADRLLGATEELMRAYQERKCCAVLTRTSPGPPYCTLYVRARVPSACCASGGTGQLAPGLHAQFVRRTRTSLGRAVRTRTVWCTTGHSEAAGLQP